MLKTRYIENSNYYNSKKFILVTCGIFIPLMTFLLQLIYAHDYFDIENEGRAIIIGIIVIIVLSVIYFAIAKKLGFKIYKTLQLERKIKFDEKGIHIVNKDKELLVKAWNNVTSLTFPNHLKPQTGKIIGLFIDEDPNVRHYIEVETAHTNTTYHFELDSRYSLVQLEKMYAFWSKKGITLFYE